MTIIYCNWQDPDSIPLRSVFNNLNAKVIELTKDSTDWEDIVDNAISTEEDTLVFLGHGSPYGLYFPKDDYSTYVLHENNVHLIHAKRVIYIWCYASDFVRNNNLHGFATSMFISNEKEAYNEFIYGYDQHFIDLIGKYFFEEVHDLLKNNVPLEDWVMILGAHMDIENDIDVFNRQGLYYQKF